MIWLSRLESTANKHRLAAGKAARTVKANVVLDEVIRVHNREALAQDAPDLLSQAVTQLLLKDWRAQPKRKVSWQRYWRGMSLPSTFVYEGAIVPTKTISEVARHPWLAQRITGQLTQPIKARLQQLNTYLFAKPRATSHYSQACLGIVSGLCLYLVTKKRWTPCRLMAGSMSF